MSESIAKEALTVARIVGELDRIQISLDEIRRKLSELDGKEPVIKFEKEIKIEDLKKFATETLEQGGREYFLDLLHKHGAKKLSEVKQCDYVSVLEGLKSWLNIPF
ncbi:hypothetical protein [Succinivibrio sp.]|uniref:hypothetical protein n=1 Tax=Succinivibrio sp. TaxID=2053619 RepID=UPI0038663ACD